MNTSWHNLTVSKLDDGGICLKQSECGDDSVIHLHPQQLRSVAEEIGLVAPNHSTDDLSKRMAEQLCRVYLQMTDDYRHLSPALEIVHSRLDGFIDGIPEQIFPYHLWEESRDLLQPGSEV